MTVGRRSIGTFILILSLIVFHYSGQNYFYLRFMIWCETILNEDGKCQGLDFRMTRHSWNRDKTPGEPVGYFNVSIGDVQLKCFKKESKDLPKNSDKKELLEVDERWHNLEDISKFHFKLKEMLRDDITLDVKVVILENKDLNF